MDSVRRRVVAHGRVQGVFFRDATRREAERRGVAGSATNAPDGSVECVFEGEAGAVEAMIAFVRGGPGHASVDTVDVTEEQPRGLSGFDTR
jgi:acylphosphatase